MLRSGKCIALVFVLGAAVKQSHSQTQVITPKIVSAEAASISKFGDLPIGKFTGVPDISIPVYTLSIGAYKLPVQLRYHASGIKVNEQSSNVGTGWTLDAGGTISHSIYGNDDFASGTGYLTASYKLPDHALSPAYNSSATDFPGGYDYFLAKKIASHEIDAQPDLFQYNFNGNSGRFYFDYNQQVHPVPMNAMKFAGASGSFDGAITITDVNGYKYIFGATEYTDCADYCGTHHYYGTYFLTKILLPEKDSIVFNYDDIVYDFNAKGSSMRSTPMAGYGNIDWLIVSQSLDCYGGPDAVPSTIHSKRLASITGSRNISVLFNYAGARYDLHNNTKLSSIAIQYKGNTTKTISLYQSYFTPAGYGTPSSADYDVLRLKLDSVNMGSPAETYSFLYDESVRLPNKLSSAIDHYGYYNGATGNTTLLPVDTDHGFNTGANREVDTSYLKAANLKTLIYPTGGRTNFYFEANTYYKSSETRFTGGLRIKQMITSSMAADPNPVIRTFMYDDPATGHTSGLISYEPVYVAPTSYTALSTNTTEGNTYEVSSNYWRQSSSALEPLTTNQGSTIGYTYVEELTGINGENGKTVSRFSYSGDYGGSLTAPSVPYISMDWQNGQLLEETVFRKNSSNFYPVTRTKNFYSVNPESAFWNAHYTSGSYSSNDYFRGWGVALEYKHAEYFNGLVMYPAEFKYNDYHFLSKWVRLDSTANYTYHQSDTNQYLRNISRMDYGNMYNFLPTVVSTVNSKGLVEEQLTRYTNDSIPALPTGAQDAKTTLRNANRLNAVLEQVKKVNTIETTRERNDFSNYSGGETRIGQVWFSTRAGTLQQRLTVNNYDTKGNIAGYTDEHGTVKSYLYDYSVMYPVAETINAAVGAVAHTSFEADGKGNWDYSPSGAGSAGGSVTGDKSYSLSTSNIERTGLSSSQTYMLTYWLKDTVGSVAINSGSGGTALVTKNGWILYQREITGVSSVTLSGSGRIDELRLYPRNAQMTTYTYAPLIGMTSQCDANNRITYYEYDSFGRLQRIRDQDKNILKTFDYTYGQTQ